MANNILSRAKHAWNVFTNREPLVNYQSYGMGYRPDRHRMSCGNERSIINAAYNRIAVDVSQIDIMQVKLDEHDRYLETPDTPLNECLRVSANIDQSGRAFKIDAVMSMFDEGVVALIPVDYDYSYKTQKIDIGSIRTGKVIEWYPDKVKVRAYNERTGKHQDIVMRKSMVAIIENPFYAVMNESNSTLRRLIRKLNLLDAIDEQSGSGKLDLIIQLPYVIKSDARRQQAEQRRKSIEDQLNGSKYGIAYTDGTEHITQLNRPVENNLMNQIKYLTDMLFGQMGFSMALLDGTADEKQMLNYNNRIIEPIVSGFVDEIKRTWLTRDQRLKEHMSVMFFRDPFKLVTLDKMADIADKFTRNEILTSNEVRQFIGIPPADDPGADELRNKNISASNEPPMGEEPMDPEADSMPSEFEEET